MVCGNGQSFSLVGASMQSAATNVAAYLDEVADSRRDALTALRKLCVKCLVGYQEGMDYGMPTYKKNGVVEVGFASQKNYISLYIVKKGVVDAHRADLAGASVGKGCIRFSSPEKLDFKVIEKLLRATCASKEAPC
jgi:uncharacterized protein YdhG (YjbR/CyaY superfamily)